jgi:hypothetical protein
MGHFNRECPRLGSPTGEKRVLFQENKEALMMGGYKPLCQVDYLISFRCHNRKKMCGSIPVYPPFWGMDFVIVLYTYLFDFSSPPP